MHIMSVGSKGRSQTIALHNVGEIVSQTVIPVRNILTFSSTNMFSLL